MDAAISRKLEERSMPVPWCGCFVWTASLASHGYGDFRHNHKHYLAHRAAWEQEHGPIPQGKHVLHKCDNRLCVNPEHLFLGSNEENMRDKVLKGRHVPGYCQIKLTTEQVAEIRELCASGTPQKELAAKFHRHPDHVP